MNYGNQARIFLTPLIENNYYKINFSLIPETKEISQIKVILFRPGGDLIFELFPIYEDGHWFAHIIEYETKDNDPQTQIKKGEKTVQTTVRDLAKFFKNYIIQKKALHEELIKDLSH